MNPEQALLYNKGESEQALWYNRIKVNMSKLYGTIKVNLSKLYGTIKVNLEQSLSILIKQVIVYLSVYLFGYGRPNRKA